jgi:hypothetical protein
MTRIRIPFGSATLGFEIRERNLLAVLTRTRGMLPVAKR